MQNREKNQALMERCPRESEKQINKREVERECVYSLWRYRWFNGSVIDIIRKKRREMNISSELKREKIAHGTGTLNLGDLSKETALQEKSLQVLRGCFQVIWALVASFSTAGNTPSLTTWSWKENPWFCKSNTFSISQWQVLLNNSGLSELQWYDSILSQGMLSTVYIA